MGIRESKAGAVAQAGADAGLVVEVDPCGLFPMATGLEFDGTNAVPSPCVH